MNLLGVGNTMPSVGISQEKQGHLHMYSQRQDNFSLHKLNGLFLSLISYHQISLTQCSDCTSHKPQ
jgi:hypothetical protein